MIAAHERQALRLLDDALARMGTDPCSCSFELLVEEVLDRCDLAPGERSEAARLLRPSRPARRLTVACGGGRSMQYCEHE